MFTALIERLPAVRRLRKAIEAGTAEIIRLDDLCRAAKAKAEETALDLAEAETDLEREREQLAIVTDRRNQLFRQVDEQNLTIQRQAVTIDGLRSDRKNVEGVLEQQKALIAEAQLHDERWAKTVFTLNTLLRERNEELEQLRNEIADSDTRWEEFNRPVLFSRTGGFTDFELEEILAGKGNDRQVRAIAQILDECVVQAMSEAATAPAATIATGPHAGRGFTAEDRTFSAGGVYALTQFKQVLEDRLATSPERQAA